MKPSNTAYVMSLSLRYAKASILYLSAGATLAFFTFAGILSFSLTALYFMQLYGFVAMMIFGVSYLLVPAFAHGPLQSPTLANAQFWLLNIGTIGLSVAFSGLVVGEWVRYLTVTTLLIQLSAVYAHAYNIRRTTSHWKGSPSEALMRSIEKNQ